MKSIHNFKNFVNLTEYKDDKYIDLSVNVNNIASISWINEPDTIARSIVHLVDGNSCYVMESNREIERRIRKVFYDT